MTRARRRPGRPHRSVLVRTAALLAGFVTLSNLGYVLAQTVRPDMVASMRQAVAVEDFMNNNPLFLNLRESALIPSFGIAIIVFVGLSLTHLVAVGPKGQAIADEQDAVGWYRLSERVVHWLVAVVFVLLLVSGLALTFGRYLGGGPVSLWLRTSHEYGGLVFIPLLAIMIVMWIANAIPRSYDLTWFRHLGGYLGYKGTVPAGKFNGGQKLWYWIMTLTGILLAWSGAFQFFRLGDAADMRLYVLVHFFASIPMILMFVVHLYLSTVGTRGSFMSMVHGKASRTAVSQLHPEAPAVREQAEQA